MSNAEEFLAGCNLLMCGQHPRDILVKAKGILQDPLRWARGARARDALGRPVKPEDPTAVSWDIEGAIAVSCNCWGILPPYFMLLLDSVALEYQVDGINLFEEFFEHEALLELLDRAIARAG